MPVFSKTLIQRIQSLLRQGLNLYAHCFNLRLDFSVRQIIFYVARNLNVIVLERPQDNMHGIAISSGQ